MSQTAAQDLLLAETDARGVCRITLNRPDKHNAFNDALIGELYSTFTWIAEAEDVRAVVLTGAGASFSAGGDLGWMQQAATYAYDDNLRDAERLSNMLHTLNTCPKPTLALVNGAAMGGGVGLVACCDIVLAVADARFALSEVRLGLTPATISPYVVAKMGQSAARRYFLTGERFDAAAARAVGLVHEVVDTADALETAAAPVLKALLAGAPGAQAAAKDLIFTVDGAAIDANLREDTAERIAQRRATDEGREGIAAFLEKRKPTWLAG
ncbi:methylglutaconyl-CoA hydratase [Rhodothalassium salexigens DSM 2132]|uniref:Methylglutaconyl-CoA hydratase n=1 Tax=Rhodothalassium salexigens DSM 2132 TaxID=1188247 RepID=A0A4R2PF41_RHOSA|nr:enoyl-CoA hydratase-related protein [Rhodothalassium salexigens]MBB4211792.1 methylglutaconyl-CoA hydratase [Rhodothalassium salexigens DSM 2132]MBK1638127.1 enoyl-CoA hydratase [Rhodothalassium salexigens DSM 2132]TCP33910.1 methylglutaconyl-CoA hydratase [Rhodothalassium salexigens DSM 2132]